MSKYDPVEIASLSAVLLSKRDNVEPHHVREAVQNAKMIVDETAAALAYAEAEQA